MSRRDTIITAVLVNVGLLVILFITADNPAASPEMSSELEQIPQVAEMEQVPQQKEVEKKTFVATEEVDDVLNKLTRQKNVEEEVFHDQLSSAEEVKLLDQGYVEVTVKNGDYLARIAKMNDTTVEDIVKANNLKSTNLKVGQVLRIPVGKIDDSKDQQLAAADDDPAYYTIRSGDNPWLIAARHNMPLDKLLRLNDLDNEKARHLQPGDRIRVR
ncbi:MAG: LysM peptidoglycan-binding domain-containing protein [Chlamydiota bacterium]